MSLETSSPSNPAYPFPLLRLPYELLDTIFAYAYEDDEHPEPVCRALRQFAQRRLWRDPVITTYRSLARFCRTINSGNRAAAYVQLLSLDFSRCEDVNGTSETGFRRLVGARSFSKTLSRLDKLRCLRLVELDQDLARVLPTPDLEFSALPQLRTLVITEYDTVGDETIWARRLASLDEIRLSRWVHLPQVATSMRAGKLVLAGLELDEWPCYDFAQAFPTLRHFEAYDLDADSQFYDIVSRLPRNLKELRLVNSDVVSMQAGGSLDVILPDFTILETLYLCYGTFTIPPLRAFLDMTDKLACLGFGLNSPVTDDFLHSLIEGPTRLSHLRTLELDYVICSRGLTMESQGYKLSKDAKFTPFHEYLGWHGPDWPVDCSQEGLLRVMEAATRRGVTLTGSAMDAQSWEDDYMGEVYDGLMAWGLEADNFKEAREIFGDQTVREFQSMMYSFILNVRSLFCTLRAYDSGCVGL
ncbi:hypothetical protein JCM10296v2_006434 [Rhodotorula toruloides]